MKTAYLLSIQPQWLEKILNGEKTIEIRKTIPKCELPIDVYCYCTKNRKRFRVGEHMVFCEDDLYKLPTGQIKYGCSVELMAYDNYDSNNFFNGKIPCKFTLRKIDIMDVVQIGVAEEAYNAYDSKYKLTHTKYDLQHFKPVMQLLDEACLSIDKFEKYVGILKETAIERIPNKAYAIHIEDLEIFDKPMTLHDFHNGDGDEINMQYVRWLKKNNKPEYLTQGLKRAPQSWRKVFVNE